ncbi:MAG: GNAT family N-acetyltransferase [Bacteroidia bacterium]
MLTNRTYLQLIEAKDFPLLLSMFQEPDTFKYIPKLQNLSIEEYKVFLQSRLQLVQSSQGYYWAARSLDTNEFIGALNLYPHSTPGVIHLGCQIKRAYWGQGYATEIMTAGRDYGIQILGMPKIYAFVDRDNLASVRLLDKLNFSQQAAAKSDSQTIIYQYSH